MQNFYYFWIRFTAVLLFINPVTSVDSLQSADAELTYYTCGNVKFSRKDVEMALLEGSKSILKLKDYPRRYKGPFYSEQRPLEMFPILKDNSVFDVDKDKQKYGYFIIYKMFGAAIGIIERIPVKPKFDTTRNYQDIKCSKSVIGPSRYSPSISTSSFSPNSNNYKSTLMPNNQEGYICGQRFFSLKEISEANTLANYQKEKGHKVLSIPYFSVLCPEFRCLLLSLNDMKDKSVSGGGSGDSSYFIVTDLNLDVKGLAFGPSISMLKKCELVVNSENGLPSMIVKQQSPIKFKLQTPVDPGYQCGLDFFPKRKLNTEIQKLRAAHNRFGYLFPEEYTGSSFPMKVLLWPVFPMERIYSLGRSRNNPQLNSS